MHNIYRGISSLLLMSAAIGIMAADVPSPKTPSPVTIERAYKGLSQGPLRLASLETLPKGVLLSAGKVSVTEKQLTAEIAKAKPDMLLILKKHSFFVLEQIAAEQLLTAEARAWATASKRDTKKDTDNTLIQAYLESIAAAVKVSDEEVKAFYEANKDMVGGADYESVAKDLKEYLLEQKQQEAADSHINTLSARTPVKVNPDWLKVQAAAMLNNPVDKARRSGKPTMIDFGRGGCRPCDMMTPILEELQKTYAKQCNVLFCHTGNEPIIAARYNVQSIPVQVFFNKDGNEVFRHVGFFPKEEILAKLAELGVK